ncbi:unnamed protein product [Rotaria sordida]|uniref:Endoplasmic reticulum lectin 1 n=1 Tax=Rotaria sordida TaxID=392033 RepID=A0A819S0F4_9BILA|nr:unnamed protein product [Rotaria sordida]CAF3886825.1 unnamed protein product [Rotaria sordida]CAF4061977.1 unnamed protein product [Rotaria sordida]
MFVFQITFTILSCIPLINTILDDDILYDIKWQSELNSPTELRNNFIITSKRKETYSCVLPTLESINTKSTETILLNEIEPLIEKLHSKKQCTYRLDPYWTYELCHGIHVRQYHESKIADKRTIHQEYFLGYYHSNNQDIITTIDNEQVLKIHYKTINNRVIPMLPIRYTDGTQCDINSNRPRETTVFYICHENGNNGVINFQEVSSCQYEMTVASSWICNLPEFSPTESNRHTINCYPQENAPQKPRNLKKLEYEQEQLLSKQGEGAQFTMTSADGTTFIISYRYVNEEKVNDIVNNDVKSSENEQLSSNENILEFVEGFFSGRDCLTGGSGWWRYEICYGKHVIQFHEEQGTRTTIQLGTWNYEKHVEWINTNPKKKSDSDYKQRQYVSLYYTDGDVCELTQMPRVVEVKLRCLTKENKSHVPIMYLVEPESCSYVLGIESSVFCDLIDFTDEDGIPDYDELIKHFREQ